MDDPGPLCLTCAGHTRLAARRRADAGAGSPPARSSSARLASGSVLRWRGSMETCNYPCHIPAHTQVVLPCLLNQPHTCFPVRETAHCPPDLAEESLTSKYTRTDERPQAPDRPSRAPFGTQSATQFDLVLLTSRPPAQARHRLARAYERACQLWRISTIRYTKRMNWETATAGALLRQARKRAGLS